MTNLLIKVLDSGVEKYRHTGAETVDFTMVTVSGTPANDTDVMTKAAVAGAYIPLTQKGAASGVASLDTSGKIPAAQLPNSIMEYKGVFNPSTHVPNLQNTGAAIAASVVIQDVTYTADVAGAAGNTISVAYANGAELAVTVVGNAITVTIVSGVTTANAIITAVNGNVDAAALVTASGSSENTQTAPVSTTYLAGGADAANIGDVYKATAAGSHDFGAGAITFAIGDYAIYNGTAWELAHSGSDAVVSVNSKAGVVVLNTDDISESGTPTNKWFTEARVRSTPLTGLSTASGGTLTETDTVLQAFGKVEYRVALNDAKVSYSAETARADLIASSIVDDDTTHAPSGDAVYTALAGKADVSHSHAISDVTGLETALSGKVDVSDQYKSYKNKNAGEITAGQFVYVKSTVATPGEVDLAKADAAATCVSKLGVVYDASIAADAAGNITIKRGTRVSGFSGLTIGAKLYLSPSTAGGYTQTCPSTVGHFVVILGEALSASEIEFCPEAAIEIAS